jgi:glycosyltransferase involved in cell wall biosynthesis
MNSVSSKLPKISVITPSYNSGRFIEQTIQSVLSQGYPNLEYLVMDGGSTDNTLEILQKYQGSVNWVSEKDRGQSHAINKGFALATGDVLAYLNADDIYEKGALHTVGKYFLNHPDAYWVTGRCKFIDPNGEEIRKLATLYKYLWLLLGSYKALMVTDYVSQPATFWHRNIIDRIGQFNETLHYAMDYDFSLRVGKTFKLWRIRQFLASYRIHRSSKTFSSPYSIINQFTEDLMIAENNGASKRIVKLHTFHNALIINIYRLNIRISS